MVIVIGWRILEAGQFRVLEGANFIRIHFDRNKMLLPVFDLNVLKHFNRLRVSLCVLCLLRISNLILTLVTAWVH